jgi:subtilase family serine protease
LFVPETGRFEGGRQATGSPPYPGFFFETPASIACIYHLVEVVTPGCNPNVVTLNPAGGGGAIAIVDAFHDPTAQADLDTFSDQFGLPRTKLNVVYAQGKVPDVDPSGSWELEESTDVQWAHAMAPKAKIYLVEAAENSYTSLFEGIVVASYLVAGHGGGEVSISWGGPEFSDEVLLDDYMTYPGVVYFAAAGDDPGVEYPSASPNVVSVSGTTLSRNSTTGRFLLENTWQRAGGGPSAFESRPSFQDRLAPIIGPSRGTPDISFDSNPNTGVWVYDGNPYPAITTSPVGWIPAGGTSVAAPSVAGIVNAAGHFEASSAAENALLYKDVGTSVLRDVTYGDCGLYIGDFAVPGWDFCTGVGTPLTHSGK